MIAALAILVCLLGPHAPALASAGAVTYDAAGYVHDVEANIAQLDTDASHASAVREVGLEGDAEPLVVHTRLFYDSPFSFVAPSGLADDGARFVVDSAGNTTLRAQGPSGWVEVSDHAAKRMTQRGISIADVDQALAQTPFNYWHNNMWKVGYYDPGTNAFVGTVNGAATTVITPSAGPQYIANLLAAAP